MNLTECVTFFSEKGDLRNVKLAVKKGGELDEGLELAAMNGHLDVVDFLLAQSGASDFFNWPREKDT